MNGVQIIKRERNRQLLDEGFNRDRDDKYAHEQLAEAAACYATPFHDRPFPVRDGQPPLIWPWEKEMVETNS